MGIEMTDRAMNMVDAYIRSNTKELYIELEPGASLNIPVQQQACLSSYIDERVYFGIRPDFVYLADDNEELNTINGQLIDYKKTNNSFEILLKIGQKEILFRTKKLISQSDIGKSFRINFDTYFGHIFDYETNRNLTI
jgi:multiple sugar transport system ATP-binding protein|tara:strand:+ start:300 stop:713 length:414 start_codon:yes stop_codon:yes gene_type:complete